MDIEARPNIQQILVADWTRAEPSTRPVQLAPSNPTYKYKYTVENCLPSYLHHTKSRTSCSSSSLWAQTITAPYPSTQGYAYMMQQQYYKMQAQYAEKSGAINASGHSSSESGGNDINTNNKEPMLYETPLANIGSSEGSLKDGKKQLTSKIGACGRKIADAVKSVKRDSKAQRGRSDSRVSADLSNPLKNSAIQ